MRHINAMLALVLAAALPTTSLAQTPAPTTPDEFLGLLKALKSALSPPKFVVVQGTPTATTAPSGVGFVSVSGTTKRDGTSDGGIDGSLSFGAGFGNAVSGLGGQVAVNITSVDPKDFADSGTVSLKFGHTLPPRFGNTSLGVTFDNLVPWGDSSSNQLKTSLAVTTVKQFDPNGLGDYIPVIVNFGVSSYSEYHDGATPFASLGVGLSQIASVSASYNGDYTSFGVNARIPALKDVSFSAAVLDAFNEREQRRVTFSIAYSIKNLF